MPAEFRNLDTVSAFRLLQGEERVRLSDALTPERVLAYQCGYGLADGRSLTYNYAAKAVSDAIIERFRQLAEEQSLVEKYRMILRGEIMNTGERRMVLHHLCRGELGGTVRHDGRDLRAFYEEQRERFSRFARDVHAGRVASPSGERFESVVQIGIGGSDLGPRALFLALAGHEYEYDGETRRGPLLETRFVSNVDPDDAASVLAGLDPRTTLFVLVSKSGTTQETLTNEALAIDWLSRSDVRNPRKQIACVTSETSPLATSSDYLASFFIDDFIGGRYSSSSAVGGT
ncbi:MAG: glucose-6-phosphate isomerase, partial [Spirochaetota bacterium]